MLNEKSHQTKKGLRCEPVGNTGMKSLQYLRGEKEIMCKCGEPCDKLPHETKCSKCLEKSEKHKKYRKHDNT